MLSQWRLSNFKAAGRQLDIELKPLTLVAGANSSGKSTLLQSILLLVQTLRSRASDRPIIFNGDFIKLGDFQDIKSIHIDQKAVGVGFRLAVSNDRLAARPLKKRLRSLSSESGDESERSLKAVDFGMSFHDVEIESTLEDKQSQPRLGSVTVDADYSAAQLFGERSTLALALREGEQASDQENFEGLGNVFPLIPAGLLEQDSFSDEESGLSGRVVGTKMFHFLPEGFVVLYKLSAYLAFAIKTAVLTGRASTGWLRASAGEESLLKSGVNSEVIKVIQKHLSPGDPLGDALGQETEVSIRKLASLRRRLTSPSSRRSLVGSVDDDAFVEDLIRVLSRQSGQETVSLQRPIPEDVMEACREVYRFFTGFVSYVGPLRDDPKAIYPLSSNSDVSDVGLKGEATAAVFNRFRKTKIEFVPPEDMDEAGGPFTAKSTTLEQGVLAWLRYLGVAHGVYSRDRGKFGHELKVQVGGKNQSFDLSHVGVGVSQLLPIVVSCLLAKKGSLLIFEQPELHLHPKVQTLLGDFFVAAASSGRQCIIETHSEYIINRLRLRIASSSGTDVADLAKVYFVEQAGFGTAVYLLVDIN